MPWGISGGGFLTVVANGTFNAVTTFSGADFVGPITVAPNFESGNENFGSLTIGPITVNASEGNPSEPNAYNPVSFNYSYSITNQDDWPLSFDMAIGTF